MYLDHDGFALMSLGRFPVPVVAVWHGSSPRRRCAGCSAGLRAPRLFLREVAAVGGSVRWPAVALIKQVPLSGRQKCWWPQKDHTGRRGGGGWAGPGWTLVARRGSLWRAAQSERVAGMFPGWDSRSLCRVLLGRSQCPGPVHRHWGRGHGRRARGPGGRLRSCPHPRRPGQRAQSSFGRRSNSVIF